MPAISQESGRNLPGLASGSIIEVRGTNWKIVETCRDQGETVIDCIGVSGIARNKRARFIKHLEPEMKIRDPAAIDLVADQSVGFVDTKLFLEGAFRATPPTTQEPLTLGKAALHDLSFQHVPVKMALSRLRTRLLIADDVGLGKTLEAGLIASELILRGRAKRILVVSTRAMLVQFQKEFWMRFSIPLARLDSAAIKRMRNRIPAHYNVFNQFERVIVSIDTLKRDLGIRTALEDSRWDLIIIDEAHNAANRVSATGMESLRARLARLLSRQSDNLLLLTATPHDGSQEAFSSLLAMLDPTQIPDASSLSRDVINHLLVRRFRSSPEVVTALREKIPERKLIRRNFPLGSKEEKAHKLIAELKLEMDNRKGTGRTGYQLFRTTLAKAIFSSPMACQETVEGRLERIKNAKNPELKNDIKELQRLGKLLETIGPKDFSKYQNLLGYLQNLGWKAHDPRDRLVIFSERIRTLKWLEEQLLTDLKLKKINIGRIDGQGVEADERAQDILEDFGQLNRPIRILLASDMASEGLNLHFHSHRLIHFDLPWSLLRFQQRNGRIDRYGQDRAPEITYFVGESEHSTVNDMWVLDKLVEKDEAAQSGVGDPAVFFGKGSIEDEERETELAVDQCMKPDDFGKLLDENVKRSEKRKDSKDLDSLTDLLFGEYRGDGDDGSTVKKFVSNRNELPPRIFHDTFEYCAELLRRMNAGGKELSINDLKVDEENRIIQFTLPEDMRSLDDLGYTRGKEVDDRFMPREALRGETLQLTDDTVAISAAIDQAKNEDRAWPDIQYLWDVHPVVEWLNDRSESLVGRGAAPLCKIPNFLAENEVAVLLHGAVSNRMGNAMVDAWDVIIVRAKNSLEFEVCEPVDALRFLEASGFKGKTRNPLNADHALAQKALPLAVDAFQAHLVNLREIKSQELSEEKRKIESNLKVLRERFDKQFDLEFGDIQENASTVADRRRLKRRDDRRLYVEEAFSSWRDWHCRACEVVVDPYPYVVVKAVFHG